MLLRKGKLRCFFSSSSPEFSVAVTVISWLWESSVLVEMRLEGWTVLLGHLPILSESREVMLSLLAIAVSGHVGII